MPKSPIEHCLTRLSNGDEKTHNYLDEVDAKRPTTDYL